MLKVCKIGVILKIGQNEKYFSMIWRKKVAYINFRGG